MESAGWAALAGLRQGDLLLEVDGNAVGSVEDFRKQMKSLINSKPTKTIFFVRRGIHTLYIELEPDWD